MLLGALLSIDDCSMRGWTSASVRSSKTAGAIPTYLYHKSDSDWPLRRGVRRPCSEERCICKRFYGWRRASYSYEQLLLTADSRSEGVHVCFVNEQSVDISDTQFII